MDSGFNPTKELNKLRLTTTHSNIGVMIIQEHGLSTLLRSVSESIDDYIEQEKASMKPSEIAKLRYLQTNLKNSTITGAKD